MNIGIIGLGLIGGSFAKAFASMTEHDVYGMDIDADTMKKAAAKHVIAGRLDEETLPDCDLILVALRPAAAVAAVEENAKHLKKGAVVVDCCGVKRAVEPKMEQACKAAGAVYIGGHPMAGLERGGFDNAYDEMFLGASMILTPHEDVPEEALALAKNTFFEIGFGSCKISDAEEHDRIIAITSQLAHVASNAYVKSPTANDFCGYSAGSFKDLTRVARLDEHMWAELFLANADNITFEIDGLIERLKEYSDAIKAGDLERTTELLKAGREAKERL